MQIDLVREAFHYQSRFSGSTMVFKIDFPLTQDPSFSSLMNDLALLARTGFKVVIVPGAKEWIDSVLSEYGITTRMVVPEMENAPSSGPFFSLRLTAEKVMPFVEMAAFHVATRFMTALSASRTGSVIGSFVRARGLGVLNGVDMECTGRVEKILTGPVSRILDLGIVPILPCVGWGPSGKSYNVPGGEIALAASAALGAVKLFIVSASEGGGNGRVVRLTPGEAEELLEKSGGKYAGRMAEDLALAVAASKAGVERIHIINGREEGAVLRELFSNLGSGTMVYADEYEAVRPLETSDIPDILRIMEPLMRQGILVRRIPEDILEKKDDYVVFGVDGKAHACGALHLWDDSAGNAAFAGEIAAVAVDPAYADMGLGSRIVRFLVSRAKKNGLRRVFVLTSRTQDWFETLGFTESDPSVLPEIRQKTYNHDRKSKVFVLDL